MEEVKATIRVVSAEIERDGRYLITQRLSTAVLPNLWEFPGGRVREGESDGAALVRAIQMRLDVVVDVGECVLEVTHDYDDYALTLAVYCCGISAEPQARKVAALVWADPDELGNYEFPGADRKTVDQLLERP